MEIPFENYKLKPPGRQQKKKPDPPPSDDERRIVWSNYQKQAKPSATTKETNKTDTRNRKL